MDKINQQREPCCKNGCNGLAVIVVKVYTNDGGITYLGFCKKHIFTISALVDGLVQRMIDGE